MKSHNYYTFINILTFGSLDPIVYPGYVASSLTEISRSFSGYINMCWVEIRKGGPD